MSELLCAVDIPGGARVCCTTRHGAHSRKLSVADPAVNEAAVCHCLLSVSVSFPTLKKKNCVIIQQEMCDDLKTKLNYN